MYSLDFEPTTLMLRDSAIPIETTFPGSIYDLQLSLEAPSSNASRCKSIDHLESVHKQLEAIANQLTPPLLADEKMQDELDSFSYSEPHTPSEPLMSPSEYTNPLSQAENISLSLPYSEDGRMTNEESEKSIFYKYDTSSLMYGNDDLTTFTGVVNCDEVLGSRGKREMHPQEFKKIENVQIGNKWKSSQENSPLGSRKGKLTWLQRQALDMIFAVTDRPSRGLVSHIATELCLHHIVVKNFFSNGRRRLRRAAARLSDPERTRRENQKRKEKRRLAAMALTASMVEGCNGNNASLKPIGVETFETQEPRSVPVVSPERKALMEKLAVKVQRSAAQKGLSTNLVQSESLSSKLNGTNGTASQCYQPIKTVISREIQKPSRQHSTFLPSMETIYEIPAHSYQIAQVDSPYIKQGEREFTANLFSSLNKGRFASHRYSPPALQKNFSIYTSSNPDQNRSLYYGNNLDVNTM